MVQQYLGRVLFSKKAEAMWSRCGAPGALGGVAAGDNDMPVRGQVRANPSCAGRQLAVAVQYGGVVGVVHNEQPGLSEVRQPVPKAVRGITGAVLEGRAQAPGDGKHSGLQGGPVPGVDPPAAEGDLVGHFECEGGLSAPTGPAQDVDRPVGRPGEQPSQAVELHVPTA
ncbi:hypothetical protein [Streptomyces hydrogenans]